MSLSLRPVATKTAVILRDRGRRAFMSLSLRPVATKTAAILRDRGRRAFMSLRPFSSCSNKDCSYPKRSGATSFYVS